jgi:hypothetical protein
MQLSLFKQPPRLRVLVACECSGAVRDAFIAAGHDAVSCDVQPDASPHGGPHIEGDVLAVLNQGWDLMVAHPPCRYLCSSGLHWNKRRPGRAALSDEALVFVHKLMAAPIPRIAIENPVGRIGTQIRPADQWLHPYQFGCDASKKTGLWLKGLPLLVPLPQDQWVSPRIVAGKPRWSNQTDSGQNRLGPSAARSQMRATTYPGIARAMAEQWGRHATT